MTAIEIARRMAELGEPAKAREAYSLAIHENAGADPAQDMEAALYILQAGGNYKTSYTCFGGPLQPGTFSGGLPGHSDGGVLCPQREGTAEPL